MVGSNPQAVSSPEQRFFSAGALKQFTTDIFVSLGVPEADARLTAGLMIEADLLGYSSHGIFRLKQYSDRLRDGGTNPRANIKVVREEGATGLVDGDNGLGHLAMAFATDLAIKKAAKSGIGWIGVRNSNHAGPASIYVRRPVEHDMVGIYAAVGSANHVPPFGGTDLLLGTNPIAIAVPAGQSQPFILDMATTVAAVGKIKALAQQGKSMPEGWMVGPDGQPLTDPSLREQGFLLPIGGAKGYGLAMAIGLLAGTLNGASFGKSVVDFTKDTSSQTNTGQFIAAISISAFSDVAEFKETVDMVFDEMRESAALPGHEPVRIPGEGREAVYDQRLREGIPLHGNLIQTLNQIATEFQAPSLT